MHKTNNQPNIDVSHHVRWQIPRASLSSGSRSMYSSTDSIDASLEKSGKSRKNGRRESYSTGSDTKHYKTKKLSERRDEGPYSMPSSTGSSLSSTMQPDKKFSRRKFSESLITAATAERVHGSASSQGSSSNSLHSASSLLLSVQNLEKFTRLTSNQGRIDKLRTIPRNDCDNGNNKQSFDNSHLILDMDKLISNNKSTAANDTINYNAGAVCGRENQQHNFFKPKEHDQLSIASSTHFTLVNGCGRSNVKSQNSFCRHGRQITILIVTMTIFFIIGILVILYLMDRRAKAMPAFHQ